VKKVTEEAGKKHPKLTVAEATSLTAEATQIEAVLGC
jgi:hypothetical protein